MKTSIGLITAAFIGMAGTHAFASGFECEGGDYNVKLYNHTQPSTGTRVPAALIVSDASEGTLLVRKGTEIRKRNRANTVQYVVEGNRKVDADTAILQIQFKEGREVIEAGDEVPGQLILVSDGDKQVQQLSCERYLKP